MKSSQHSSSTIRPLPAMAVKATPAGVAKEASRVIQDIEVTDPSLPQNWTRTWKWFILIVLSLMSLMGYMPASCTWKRKRY